ncbi:DUF7373 family lipoprotein [Gordonia sp. FQ]|uniref:DUF7373 family lipoprotein n=1 Tax=Gordonia sp. FQ TaxID=3446634 RepID=UPI003F84803F
MSARLRPALAATTALAATALLISACGTEDGKPTASKTASTSATGSVDLAALDTGKYPTSPRPEFGKPTDDEILKVEGQRLAQFVLVPFEIDPDVTVQKMPTNVVTGGKSLVQVYSKAVAEVPGNDAEMYGFVSTASTPDSTIRTGKRRSLQNAVFRYLTADDALTAIDQMAAAGAAEDGHSVETLPGLPDTRAVRYTSADGDPVLMTWTPQINSKNQAYVQYQWLQVTPDQESVMIPTLTAAIKKQGPLVKQFQGAQTTAEVNEGAPKRGRPLIDQNKVLIYALPYSDEEFEKMGGWAAGARAVYGPRGMAHMSTNPPADYALLTEVGATANANERSVVYRAKTDDGARKIVTSYVDDLKSSGAVAEASPKGLPDSPCVSSTTRIGNDANYICYVQKGRYVGEVQSDNLNDAHQQASAQYVILTKADQNAQ